MIEHESETFIGGFVRLAPHFFYSRIVRWKLLKQLWQLPFLIIEIIVFLVCLSVIFLHQYFKIFAILLKIRLNNYFFSFMAFLYFCLSQESYIFCLYLLAWHKYINSIEYRGSVLPFLFKSFMFLTALIMPNPFFAMVSWSKANFFLI